MTIDPKFVAMIKAHNYVVIDVETTGRERTDVICEIAITSPTALVLMRERINPRKPISAEATRIHGITDDDVKDCRDWTTVSREVIELIQGKDVVIYNAKHERMLFHQSDEQAGLDKTNWRDIGRWWCAMEFYAEVWSEPNNKFHNAKWQSLKSAITQQGLEPGMFHSALADCFMTNELCIHIAAYPERVKTFADAKPEPRPVEITHDVKRVLIDSENTYDEIARLLSLGYQIAAVIRPCALRNDPDHIGQDEAFLTRKL